MSAPPLQIEHVQIVTLNVDAANVRHHGARNIDAIKASLKKFGQQKPIVVDASGTVIAGNGTLAAAFDMGWEDIAIVRTALTDPSDLAAYAIADNRTGELASWSDELGPMLAQLAADDYDLGAIGFSDDELAGLMRGRPADGEAVTDPMAEWAGMPEVEQSDLRPEQSVIVHFESRAAAEDFAKVIGQAVNVKTKSLWHPKRTRNDFTSEVYVGGGDGDAA